MRRNQLHAHVHVTCVRALGPTSRRCSENVCVGVTGPRPARKLPTSWVALAERLRRSRGRTTPGSATDCSVGIRRWGTGMVVWQGYGHGDTADGRARHVHRRAVRIAEGRGARAQNHEPGVACSQERWRRGPASSRGGAGFRHRDLPDGNGRRRRCLLRNRGPARGRAHCGLASRLRQHGGRSAEAFRRLAPR